MSSQAFHFSVLSADHSMAVIPHIVSFMEHLGGRGWGGKLALSGGFFFPEALCCTLMKENYLC